MKLVPKIGDVAQLVERVQGVLRAIRSMHKVGGSIPSVSNKRGKLAFLFLFQTADIGRFFSVNFNKVALFNE